MGHKKKQKQCSRSKCSIRRRKAFLAKLVVCSVCLTDPLSVWECYGGERMEKEGVQSGKTQTASPSSSEEAEMKNFSEYLDVARACESRITGEDPSQIPKSRFIVSNQTENDSRVISIVSQINDGEEAVFYVAGRNFIPNGTAAAEAFGGEIVYSNYLEEKINSGDTWYIARMGIHRIGSAEGEKSWEKVRETPATCMGKGVEVYVCTETGQEQEIFTAPLGHRDDDRDSVCDRCFQRAFPQKVGSRIQTVCCERDLTFTCIDEDYEGRGMLYLADQAVETDFFGGYGSCDYRESQVRRYFRDGFQNGCSLQNSLQKFQLTETSGSDYAMSLSKEEYDAYRDKITGAGFLLRDSEKGKVWGIDESGSFVLVDPNQKSYGIRPAILLKKPEPGIPERIHWTLGDLQRVEIDNKSYLFRCIDPNYSDGMENHQQVALFLSETVIPANYGSDYVVEEQEDGSHRYVFQPGPIVNFGDTNDYKYSRIHQWLKEAGESIFMAEQIQIGTDTAWTGKTPEGEYSDFKSDSLSPHYIGNQKLWAKLFILSVDEAMKYRESLWKFGCSQTENPESQVSGFSKGFWLRNPMGITNSWDTGYVYGVDLEQGNIHPESIFSKGTAGDEELDITSSFGIRPAFVMKQD